MAGFQIRKYQDEDDEAVKEIFTLGMIEHVPASFVHMLKQPLTQMILMCVFCALLTSSKSFLLPILAVTLLLAGIRQLASYLFNSYIETSLKEDLASIRKSYMEKKDTCFWVAEIEGRVVATVACLPCETQPGFLELKRMSVRRTHRGLGIGKALCRAVADFCRERGFPAVVLYTSVGTLQDQMAHYQIRKYRDEDYETVRELYSTGFGEHLHAVCLQALRQLWAQLTLAGVFSVLLIFSRSLLVSFLGLGLTLLAAREGVRFLFGQGIKLGLSEDLQDIRKSYMQGEASCFWVAEIQEYIVGTVAILPAHGEQGSWELKRISVRRPYRGLGIAKALCRTALDFVADCGVENVVLYTSMLQTDAHRLYHSLGFYKEEEFIWPSLPAKLIQFMVFKYRYRVPH
ncbi:hypothetical protein JZ751_012588 [Albula glossodonta]|uniref:N-acetyltransferase domain-containing protein n=1 Tax=Albula glossodonta TaxID=121402 RepID=A0A8T2NX83_9TELE|nr:hypothetical protein JZ751_012588 [Albula glossodonta]